MSTVPYTMRTAITEEIASAENPYVTEQQRVCGYDSLELTQSASFVATIFLLLSKEFPSKAQEELLNSLAIALINPGPRHPATRAAMVAGVSKSRHAHILPVALLTLNGDRGGSGEVEQSHAWLSAHLQEAPDLIKCQPPGFGDRYGSRDPLIARTLLHFASLSAAGPAIQWLVEYNQKCNEKTGVLDTGLCAAVSLDLGFNSRQAAALFQLFRAPGLLAHGLEQTHNPISAYPVMEDDTYELK